MRFLIASPTPEGTKLTWQHETGDKINDPFTLEFRRVGIGLSLASPAFAVCVGERFYIHEERIERVYVILDEAEAAIPNQLFPKVIDWKDNYHANHLWVANQPVEHVEALRRLEGLTHYSVVGDPGRRFPSFQHREHIARPQTLTVPDHETLHHDIEALLSTDAIDPHSGLPMVSMDPPHDPIPRLLFPFDFNTLQTQAAIRQQREVACTALWMGVMGLERSNVVHQDNEEEHEHVGDNITGY